MLVKQRREPLRTGIVFLQLQQRTEFRQHAIAVQTLTLPDDDAFDVEPILRAARNRLEHNQILRRAREQGDLRRDVNRRRPVEHSDLVRQSAERNIERHTIRRLDEQHTAIDGERRASDILAA